MELAASVVKLGISNVAVRFHDHLHPDDLNANLIIVGGPDANPVAYQFSAVNKPTFCWPSPDSHIVSLFDRRDGVYHSPTLGESKEPGVDYAVVTRGRNPLQPEGDALLLAGCWGFGTWASASVAFRPDFNSHEMVKSGEDFEALVRVAVRSDSLVDIDLLEVRLLRENERTH
jgi:hypothetical protein